MKKSADAPPDQIANYFFKSFINNQCNICWGLFSKKSQQDFLQWSLNDTYERYPEACKAAQLGTPEINLMFEKNDTILIKSFWKRFFLRSGAADIYRFGYFSTLQNDGKKALVRVQIQYPDGRSTHIDFTMINERGWKLAYRESGLPF